MGTLAATLAHSNRGEETILGHLSHTYIYEAGGMASLAGVHPKVLQNQLDGTLDLDEVEEAISMDDSHFPITRLLFLENTHNRRKGVPLTIDYTKNAGELSKRMNLLLHLDGARIFNAAAALNVSVKQLAYPVDSVTFCLSKGLSAPVGSLLCGNKDFIYRAHRARKLLGGGMRQAGVLAAAGIVALEKMSGRLDEDHKRARILAEELARIEGIQMDVSSQFTNMVYFDLSDELAITPEKLVEKSANKGILFNNTSGRNFRMVTHAWVDDTAVETALDVIQEIITINH
jgi:threonine aldolase